MKQRKLKAIENEHERFLTKIKKVNDCWEWQGRLNHNGYGEISLWRGNKWKNIRAHRYSFEFYNNAKLGDSIVMHTCDNPCCVNPEHLVAGTMLDNVIDMLIKGRGAYNNYVPQHQEEAIKQKYAIGFTQAQLSEIYGVCQSQISRIINNKAWKGQQSV